MIRLALVMKKTKIEQQDICTNAECNGKLATRIRFIEVPLAVHDCKEWANAWIKTLPKEKNVEYYLTSVEAFPQIED